MPIICFPLNQSRTNFKFVDADSVVPVVRCKDCVHWYDREEVCLKIYSDGAVSPYAWQYRKPTDFCSYGERREDDDTTTT